MTFSKNAMCGILTFILVVAVLGIVGCGKRNDHNTTNPYLAPEYFDANATFYIDKGGISLWGSKVLALRDRANKPYQKDFKIQACLKDKALMGAVQFQDFRIKAGNNEILKQTDVLGCLIWDEQIRYDHWTKDAELLVVRTIEAVRGHVGAVSIELAINPWASEDSLTVTDLRFEAALKTQTLPDAVNYSMSQFQSGANQQTYPVFSMEVDKGRVAQAINRQKNGGTSVSVPETRMRLDAISLQFLGHDYDSYEITSTLNLKVAHKYRVRINPQFIRESFNGKQIFETISSGLVKFHVAILKDTLDTKPGNTTYYLDQVLATTEFVAEMVDGVMVADMTLKFQDLAPLTGRTILILSSSSLPGYIQFRDANYASPVGPLVSTSSISFIPSAMSAETIHKNHLAYVAKNENRAKTISNLAFLKEKTGIVEVPKIIDRPSSTPRGIVEVNHYNEMIKTLETGAELSQSTKYAVCSYLAQEKERGIRICDAKALDLVNYRRREVVEEITKAVPERIGVTLNEDLTINMNYGITNEQSKGNGKSAKLGWNAGVNAGLNMGWTGGMDFDLIGKDQPAWGWVAKLANLFGAVSKITSVFKLAGVNLGANVGGVASYNHDVYTWSLMNSRRETGAIATSVKYSANAEMKTFAFTGKFRKCWIVNLNSAFKEKISKQLGKEFSELGLPKGVYACAPKLEEGTRKEMFVLINSTSGIANSPLTDSLSSSEAPLRMFFRGPAAYSVFKYLMMEEKMEVRFDKFPVDELIKDVRTLKNEGDMFLNQEFPGVLNPILE